MRPPSPARDEFPSFGGRPPGRARHRVREGRRRASEGGATARTRKSVATIRCRVIAWRQRAISGPTSTDRKPKDVSTSRSAASAGSPGASQRPGNSPETGKTPPLVDGRRPRAVADGDERPHALTPPRTAGRALFSGEDSGASSVATHHARTGHLAALRPRRSTHERPEFDERFVEGPRRIVPHESSDLGFHGATPERASRGLRAIPRFGEITRPTFPSTGGHGFAEGERGDGPRGVGADAREFRVSTSKRSGMRPSWSATQARAPSRRRRRTRR
jgi:hypothetical protein